MHVYIHTCVKVDRSEYVSQDCAMHCGVAQKTLYLAGFARFYPGQSAGVLS